MAAAAAGQAARPAVGILRKSQYRSVIRKNIRVEPIIQNVASACHKVVHCYVGMSVVFHAPYKPLSSSMKFLSR